MIVGADNINQDCRDIQDKGESMKQIMFFFMVVVGIGLSPFSSHAGGEVRYGLVTGVSPWFEHVDIRTDAPHVDPDGCGAADYYRINLTRPGANARLATIMLAYSLRKTVGLSLDGCVEDAPEIAGVRGFGQ